MWKRSKLVPSPELKGATSRSDLWRRVGYWEDEVMAWRRKERRRVQTSDGADGKGSWRMATYRDCVATRLPYVERSLR